MRSDGGIDRQLVWSLVNAAALAVGSLGPWATVGPLSISGTSFDNRGLLTLALAIGAAAAAARRLHIGIVALLGIVGLAIGGISYFDVRDVADEAGAASFLSVSVGWGLLVVLIASAAMIGGAVRAWAGRASDQEQPAA